VRPFFRIPRRSRVPFTLGLSSVAALSRISGVSFTSSLSLPTDVPRCGGVPLRLPRSRDTGASTSVHDRAGGAGSQGYGNASCFAGAHPESVESKRIAAERVRVAHVGGYIVPGATVCPMEPLSLDSGIRVRPRARRVFRQPLSSTLGGSSYLHSRSRWEAVAFCREFLQSPDL
jgi:hypothetical protein